MYIDIYIFLIYFFPYIPDHSFWQRRYRLISHFGFIHYDYFDVLILFSSRIMNSEAELIFLALNLKKKNERTAYMSHISLVITMPVEL